MRIKLILIAGLLILLFSLFSVPTTASEGFTPGQIEPGPYELPACFCDSYPVECYCRVRN